MAVVFVLYVSFAYYAGKAVGRKEGYIRGMRDLITWREQERIERRHNIVADGFGNAWLPCSVCGSKLQIVRPGHAVCPKCGEAPIETT